MIQGNINLKGNNVRHKLTNSKEAHGVLGRATAKAGLTSRDCSMGFFFVWNIFCLIKNVWIGDRNDKNTEFCLAMV